VSVFGGADRDVTFHGRNPALMEPGLRPCADADRGRVAQVSAGNADTTIAEAICGRPSPGSRHMHENNQDAVPVLQQLTFDLAGEEYGVEILAVREIRGWSRVTRIPQTPAYLLGVLNLRGAIVPIMDLRLRFGLERESYGDSTVVIIVAIAERLFGIVVDAVSDVVDIDPAAIKPVPDMGAVVDTRYLKGLATHVERMVMLLDVEKLMRPEDVETLDAALPAVHDVEVAA
jgi:purine-binding chemotaxis protein CheW